MTTSTARVELETSLEDALDATINPDERPGYIVKNLEDAEWAARKRAQAQAKVDEVKAVAKSRRTVIDEWEADATKAPLDDVAYFDGLLTFYHQTKVRQELADKVKDKDLTKSIKLPGGITLASRAKPAVYTVDDDAFQPWAEVNRPDLVETTTKTKLAELKKAVTPGKDGTAVIKIDDKVVTVPGVKIEDGERSFSVGVK